MIQIETSCPDNFLSDLFMLELGVHAHCPALGSVAWNPKRRLRLAPTIRIERMTYRLQGENKNLCNPHECLISYRFDSVFGGI
ncbi:hypothetical protein THICB1_50003 [Thiomonas arsenitoxydans]|uniref:Uncharacterized protein n=1 Tax=Thiomonas arsenitoxydans (strain DSM 22701 / CIP 110005 / 3As) TaxID=426114 RepID=A0ABM9T6H3_THIA3|nr:hypothetical protein THICB6_20329 [Thiomonas arsenitoxydans]CQR34878.1 hypothetical protein THICB1_50003 [Thiomonas arsenitoxydans]CQR37263.1 hypothetical protein ACO7_510001 [Thiomonas arsenitoxydans]CQR45360.1 hypothetical protein THICB3620172 [Thiomonas sp. CB3]